jgi:hypothetical protein
MTLSIDDFLNLSNLEHGLGPTGSSAMTMLYGLSINKGLLPIPHNTDHQGYVFFTKPACNLTYNNVKAISELNFLADDKENSMSNAIRCMLSPNLFGEPDINALKASSLKDSKILQRSNLINDKQAFLPISNFLESLSAMPDTQMDTYNSPEGKRGEQVTFYDGYSEFNGVFDITATFDNMDGDFICAMFGAWIEWGNRVVEGTVCPFPIFLMCNEMDYTSRYYRLIMDKTRTFVQNIAAPGYFIPTTNPDGAKFGYNRSDVYTSENNKVQINLHCVGAEKNRNILLYEFNETVEAFNVDMKDSKSNMVKLNQSKSEIPYDLKLIFDYEAYPYINIETYELEWYVEKQVYDTKIKEIKRILTGVDELLKKKSPQDTGGTQPKTQPSGNKVGVPALTSMVQSSTVGSSILTPNIMPPPDKTGK